MGVYNGIKYIRPAVESILAQTYRDFEFIIFDDRCTDGTSEILEEYAKKDKRVIIVKNEKNIGLTASLNIGLKMAKGDLIARMDADDIAKPERFAKQIAFLDAHPDVAVLGTWADIIDPDGKVIGEFTYATEPEQIRKNMVERHQIIHPAVMFRKSILEKSGVYDEYYKSAQDYEFFSRVLMHYKAANLPEKLLQYRWDFTQGEGFLFGKRQQKEALQTRWLMISKRGWPKSHVVYMIKPALSYVVPMWLKKAILRQLSKRKKK
jgi:glycosyltransferase involved in cell wall biosynthesis